MDVSGLGFCASRPTSKSGADGQVVGSWHPDADATLAAALTCCAGNGDQKARRTGETTKQPLNHRAGKAGSFRLSLWFLPRAFCSHGGRGCQSALGLPCALRTHGGDDDGNASGLAAAGAYGAVPMVDVLDAFAAGAAVNDEYSSTACHIRSTLSAQIRPG